MLLYFRGCVIWLYQLILAGMSDHQKVQSKIRRSSFTLEDNLLSEADSTTSQVHSNILPTPQKSQQLHNQQIFFSEMHQGKLEELTELDFGHRHQPQHPPEENLLELAEYQSEASQKFIGYLNYYEFLDSRVIEVEGPQLINEGIMTSYKLYLLKSRKADSKDYDTCVSRRFSDFQYLQKTIIENYGGYIIPLLPQKNFWTNINLEGKQYIELRRRSLEKYIKRLLSHENLRMTDEVKNFMFFDELKFSENKGQFFSQIKTEEKVKSLAANAISYGRGLLSKFISPGLNIVNYETYGNSQVKISKPTKQDLKLTEFEILITELMKVTGKLQRIVENSTKEMQVLNQIESKCKQKQSNFGSMLQQFQDVSKFILSCYQALQRRKQLRLKVEEYRIEQQALSVKLKDNPRSYEMDILRNKISKTQQKNDEWTKSLLLEFNKNVQLGRSMIERFINQFSKAKRDFYHTYSQ